MSKKKIKIGDYSFTIDKEDKIFFPQSKITKGDLLNYYQRIAPTMFPHVQDRIITMQRFPDGIKKEGFYQKDAPDYFPSWIKTKKIAKEEGGYVHYVVIANQATIVYLVNQGCITIHGMLCKADKIHYPDKLIFDLDPSGKAKYSDVIWTARELKTILEDDLKLKTFVMTTGSRGVHVVLPLIRELTFDKVRTFSRNVAKFLIHKHPTRCTIEMNLKKRGNKIFIDYLRNAFGATGVAPYAVRAREDASVATPLHWDELLKKHYGSQHFTIKNIFRRLGQIDDPWKNFFKSAQSIKQAIKKLDKLTHQKKK